MTESPSPVNSEKHTPASSITPPTTTYNHLDTAQPAPLDVQPQKESSLWKYVPFQYMSLKPKLRNPYITTAIACMGGMLFGFGSTNMTPFIGQDSYERYFGQFSSLHQSCLTAAMPGGAMLGALFSFFFAEHIGRRGMVEFSGLIFVIGSAIQTACNNRVSLSFGRIIASLGIGTASSNVPMYLSEMVPARQRGRYVACFQFSVNLGMLVMFYIGFGCSFIQSASSFRLAWGIQMIPGTLMFIGALFLNESPRWLASKGRWDEVVEVLCAINKANPEDPVIQDEVHNFQRDLEVKPGTFKDLFTKRNWRQTFCATFAMFTQQYVGCNAILYFSTGITAQIGYTGTMNSIMGSIDYCVLVGSTIPSVLLFDYMKRRYTMLIGAVALLICMAVVAGIEATRGHAVPHGLSADPSVRWTVDDEAPGKAALAFSYIYLGVYSLSWGPVAWVYVGEIFNQEVRSIGNALASIVNWMFNFSLSVYTEIAFQQIQWKTYVIFAVFCFLAIPVVFFFYPETTGYELEQISEIFDSGIPAWKTDPLYKAFMRHVMKKEVKLPIAEKSKKDDLEAEHNEDADVVSIA